MKKKKMEIYISAYANFKLDFSKLNTIEYTRLLDITNCHISLNSRPKTTLVLVKKTLLIQQRSG